MQSWPDVAVPTLPARAGTDADRGADTDTDTAAVRLHDTATGAVVPVRPTDGTARLYVCGITPYDATHLGHAATYLAFDVLVRQWRDAGLEVHYVQNVTDVDDPLLERAQRDGVAWQALARRETELFREDMTALRVLPPTDFVGAVEAMDEISALVDRLRSVGAAYAVPSPDAADDLYFPVKAAPHFGELSGLDTGQMLRLFAERGGDPDRTGKQDRLDSLLWRAARPGEPAWDSPLGPGRPGWHVECAAIALNRLGPTVDVQGGGSDLAFPHHEHSNACSQVLTGAWPVARVSAHAGMVGLDGEKMSKSRGNLVRVSQLRRDGVDPAAVRLALLAGHYRADRDWSAEVLDAGQQRLARWRSAAQRAAGPSGAALLAGVRASLADDLDTPAALAAVDGWCAASGDDPDAPVLVRDLVDALLGVPLKP